MDDSVSSITGCAAFLLNPVGFFNLQEINLHLFIIKERNGVRAIIQNQINVSYDRLFSIKTGDLVSVHIHNINVSIILLSAIK